MAPPSLPRPRRAPRFFSSSRRVGKESHPTPAQPSGRSAETLFSCFSGDGFPVKLREPKMGAVLADGHCAFETFF